VTAWHQVAVGEDCLLQLKNIAIDRNSPRCMHGTDLELSPTLREDG